MGDRIETSSRLDLLHYITLRLHIIRPSRLQKWKVNKPHHLPIVSPTHAEPNNTSSPTRNTTQPSPAFSAACLTTTKLPTYLSYKTKPQPTFIFSSPSFNIFTVKSTKSKHPSQITHNNSNMPSKSSTSTSSRKAKILPHHRRPRHEVLIKQIHRPPSPGTLERAIHHRRCRSDV